MRKPNPHTPLSIAFSIRLFTCCLASLLCSPAFSAESDKAQQPESSGFSAIEVAYWQSLNKELSELRSGNAEAAIRRLPLQATPEQLSAIASRLESFLDRRDADPIEDLNASLQSYRQQIVELVDLAISPVIDSAKFNTTFETNGMQRMATVLRIGKQIGAIDERKPRIARLHQSINAAMLEAGHRPAPFFQVLAIGDTPKVSGETIDPAERDARFVADSRNIHPLYGELAKQHLIKSRDENGISEKVIMSSFQQTFKRLQESMASASLAELADIRDMRLAAEQPGTFDLPGRMLQLEIMHREDQVAFQLGMQEWQGASLRWAGEGDDLAPLSLTTDIALAPDGSWFAYAEDADTLVVAQPDGSEAFRIDTEAPIRAIATNAHGDILYFTTEAVYLLDPGKPSPQPIEQAKRPTRFVQPLMRSAQSFDRTVFAIGVMPGVTTGLTENTFASQNPSSRISAVGISGDGTIVAYGYAGDTFLAGDNQMEGVYMMSFEQGDIDVEKEIVAVHVSTPIRGAITAIDLDETGERLVISNFGPFGGSVSYFQLEEGVYQRTPLTIDNQPYVWVRVLEGEPTRVLAGTRHGVVRIWNVETKELEARFEVPFGPEGVAYARQQNELLTIASGSEGTFRWSLPDGTLTAVLAGEPPLIDVDSLAQKHANEETVRKTLLDKILQTLSEKDRDSKLARIQELRTSQREGIVALGLQEMIDSWYSVIRRSKMVELINSDQFASAYAMGKSEMDDGLVTEEFIDLTVQAGKLYLVFGNGPKTLYPELIAMAENGTALHPTHLRLQNNLLELKARQLAFNRKINEALKVVDEMGQINPQEAPHGSLRISILYEGVQQVKTSNPGLAGRYLLESINYTNDAQMQLNYAQNAFAYANQAKDWRTALQAANIALNLDPNLQHDASFMHWARHAYQQVNN